MLHFPLFSLVVVSSGMFAKSQFSVSLARRRFSLIRLFRDSFILQSGRWRPCSRSQNSMKSCSCWFLLPAESFRELIVKPVIFFQWPAVIFLLPQPLDTRENVKLLLRAARWTWILEQSRNLLVLHEIIRLLWFKTDWSVGTSSHCAPSS